MLYRELVDIGRQITHKRQRLAKARIERLLQSRLDVSTDNDVLLAHLIAESLLRRMNRAELAARNVYVEELELPQIVLFYRLAQALPFIPAAHQIANAAIVKCVHSAESLTLIDIGVGEGHQVRALLSALADDRGAELPKRIRVVGIDPAAENLDRCRAEVTEVGRALATSIEWHSLNHAIEDLPEGVLEACVSSPCGPIVINAAFAVHHTIHPLADVNARTRLLARLVGLRPQLITLVEPHADHHTESLPRRVHSAWHHFRAVFRLLDESDVDAATRFTIKEKFFGREVRDIFGRSDVFRCERHEPYGAWLLRLARCGLEPTIIPMPPLTLPPHCEAETAPGLVRLRYRGTVLVAVFAYAPKHAPKHAVAPDQLTWGQRPTGKADIHG